MRQDTRAQGVSLTLLLFLVVSLLLGVGIPLLCVLVLLAMSERHLKGAMLCYPRTGRNQMNVLHSAVTGESPPRRAFIGACVQSPTDDLMFGHASSRRGSRASWRVIPRPGAQTTST